MEQKDLEQLKQLREQIIQAKQMLNLQGIQRKLTRYHDFVLDFNRRLGQVNSVEDYRSYRSQWSECGTLASLPGELANFHSYLALVEQYNALIMSAMAAGADASFMRTNPPALISETEMDVLDRSELLYRRPFNWKKLHERLVGPAARTKIFTHLIACADPEEVWVLVNEGLLKKETIQSLPYLIPISAVCGNGENEKELYLSYHDHLASLYERMDMILPPVVTMGDEPLKGVTFEGRTEKLRYLLSHVGACSDYGVDTFNQKVTLRAERYLFKPAEGEAEPAVRVIASIPGDKNFQSIDIGNLDRNLAIQLAKEHPDAEIILLFEDLDVFDAAGRDGTIHQPYAKLCVQIADKPKERERQIDTDHSRAVDELFDAEVLR